MNSGHADAAGAGNQTAALIAGGEAPGTVGTTETWNGSTWTEVSWNDYDARDVIYAE